MVNTNLGVDFFYFLIFIDSTEHLKEDSGGLVGLPKLSPVSNIDMGDGASWLGLDL